MGLLGHFSLTLQDTSVYELIHDMLSGRQRPEDIEPLRVVADKRGLHIVRGHRRGLALCALQGIWRHQTVRAPCIVYDAKDPEVAGPFVHNKDTMVDGLGLKLHGKCSEAWHLGKPLFRTPQEWCDLKADLPVPDLQNPQRSEPSTRSTVHPFDPRAKTGGEISPNSQRDSSAAGSDGSDDESTAESHHLSGDNNAESKFVCCLWLRGKCWLKGHHSVGKNLFLHQDIPGLQCGMKKKCKYKHYERSNASLDVSPTLRWRAAENDPPMIPATQPDDQIRNGSMAGHVELKEGTVVCVMNRSGSKTSGEVLEISRHANHDEAPVRVRYSSKGQAGQMKTAWLPLHRLQVPDFSQIKPKMQASGRNNLDCKVLQVSRAKDRARAPIHVHYTGKTSQPDEWIGAETFHSKSLLFHKPVLPARCLKGMCSESHEELQTEPAATASVGSSSESQNLARECGELRKGMAVCVKKDSGSNLMSAKILEVSRLSNRQQAPVKVRYSAPDKAGRYQESWIPLHRVQVPDFSKIKPGVEVTASERETGARFACRVLRVSDEKDRAQAPLYVHYGGYVSDHDEWVGADRLHSKLLIFHEAKLPSEKSRQSQLATIGYADGLVSKPQDVLVDGSEARFVCCLWLAGTCLHEEHHSVGKNLFLHQDIPGLQCGMKKKCKYKHYERSNASLDVSPTLRWRAAENDPPMIPATQPDDQTRNASITGHAELKNGMVVCVKGTGSTRMFGKVLEISSLSKRDQAPIRVRYTATDQAGQCKEDWFSLRQLQVPDFSHIKSGMKANVVEAATGKNSDCKVLQVSHAKDKAQAPVLVHYNGYVSDDDEWVGADRFRSRSLIFHEAKLPSETSKSRQSQLATTGSDVYTDGLVSKPQDVLVDGSAESKSVGRTWLAGRSSWEGQDSGAMKRYKLHETRIAAVQRGAEHVGYQTFAGDPPIIATAAQHSKRKPTAHAASPIALPWYEHDSEADASDAANSPRSDRPLGPREEDSDGGSDTYSEPPIPPCDGIESSCAAAPNDWEERMARQTLACNDL